MADERFDDFYIGDTVPIRVKYSDPDTGAAIGTTGRAYSGSADWNEITVGHIGTGAITAGRMVRRAILYPGYL